MKVITDQGVYGDEQGATRECSADEAEDDSLCATVEVLTDVDGDAVNSILLEILQSEINSAVIPLACPGRDYGEESMLFPGCRLDYVFLGRDESTIIDVASPH